MVDALHASPAQDLGDHRPAPAAKRASHPPARRGRARPARGALAGLVGGPHRRLHRDRCGRVARGRPLAATAGRAAWTLPRDRALLPVCRRLGPDRGDPRCPVVPRAGRCLARSPPRRPHLGDGAGVARAHGDRHPGHAVAHHAPDADRRSRRNACPPGTSRARRRYRGGGLGCDPRVASHRGRLPPGVCRWAGLVGPRAVASGPAGSPARLRHVVGGGWPGLARLRGAVGRGIGGTAIGVACRRRRLHASDGGLRGRVRRAAGPGCADLPRAECARRWPSDRASSGRCDGSLGRRAGGRRQRRARRGLGAGAAAPTGGAWRDGGARRVDTRSLRARDGRGRRRRRAVAPAARVEGVQGAGLGRGLAGGGASSGASCSVACGNAPRRGPHEPPTAQRPARGWSPRPAPRCHPRDVRRPRWCRAHPLGTRHSGVAGRGRRWGLGRCRRLGWRRSGRWRDSDRSHDHRACRGCGDAFRPRVGHGASGRPSRRRTRQRRPRSDSRPRLPLGGSDATPAGRRVRNP